MKKVNVNVYPTGGYFFKEADGTIIKANSSWASVIARVIAYRRRNKLPVGDPKKEVHAQACERDPANCREDVDPVTQLALRVASLKGRALAWLAGLRAKREELLWGDGENAAARAAVCAGCPAHAALAGGCGACRKALAGVRAELAGARPVDPKLGGCSILGEDCAIAVWIDQPTVDNQELPACCWRRKS